MKNLSFLATTLVLAGALSPLAQAKNVSSDLFNFSVYTSNGIQAECSDFQGRTASAGEIRLRDFTIRSLDTNTCSLSAKTTLNLIRGSIDHGDHSPSCLASDEMSSLSTSDSFYRYGDLRPTQLSFPDLNNQMIAISSFLANQGPLQYGSTTIASNRINATKEINFFEVKDLSKLFAESTLTIRANRKQIVVINIHALAAEINHVGIKLVGGVIPQHILWNFVNTTSIKLKSSGSPAFINDEAIGFPGTVFAPNAIVYFNDARITGALYAKQIIGKASDSRKGKADTCSGSVSGQINEGCFEGGGLMMGCSAPTPTPAPGQDQNPGQQQQ